jgi:Mg2+/Co2+ transporter CorB
MAGKILLSTAYIPPIEYFSLISGSSEIMIEKEENYIKQTYRNRCYILSSHGPQILSVPAILGTSHKTPVRDIRIDYSKRWQQVHIRALTAAYNSSPYFKYYFDDILKIISSNHIFLLDLNTELTYSVLNMLRINKKLQYTSEFLPVNKDTNDFRYRLMPKKKSSSAIKEYTQVFNIGNKFTTGLSVVDLIFNMGPDSFDFL